MLNLKINYNYSMESIFQSSFAEILKLSRKVLKNNIFVAVLPVCGIFSNSAKLKL